MVILKSTQRGNFPVSFAGPLRTNTLSRKHSCGVWNVKIQSWEAIAIVILTKCLYGPRICHILICKCGLWVSGCEEEEFCHVSDICDEGSLYFVCVLYPDTCVCGPYNKPLRLAWHRVFRLDTRRKVSRLYFQMDLKLSKHYNSIHQWFGCHTQFHQVITHIHYITLYIIVCFQRHFSVIGQMGFALLLAGCVTVVYGEVWCQSLTTFIVTELVIYFICFQIWS